MPPFLSKAHEQAVSGGGGNRTRVVGLPNWREQAIVTLKERDGDHCFYCGETFDAYFLDHVHAKTRGGPDDLANRVLSCGECNWEKLSHPAWVFVMRRELGLPMPHDHLIWHRLRALIRNPLGMGA